MKTVATAFTCELKDSEFDETLICSWLYTRLFTHMPFNFQCVSSQPKKVQSH